MQSNRHSAVLEKKNYRESGSYTLVNIASGGMITLADDEWLWLIETAFSAGWSPEGTTYDYWTQIDFLSEDDDPVYNTFIYITTNHRCHSWSGSYIEKENQIVSDDDAHYMRLALQSVISRTDLLQFLAAGPFRIQSE